MKKLDELDISPTPWGFGKPTKTHDAWLYCDDRRRVGAGKSNMFFVHYPYVGMMDERRVCREQTANARLIAAAPALYSEGYDDCVALRAIVHKMDEGMEILNLRDTLAKMADRIEAALAKASGESEVRHG